MQLEFFEKDEVILMKKDLDILKQSHEKIRKAMFARHGELAKNYIDLINRLEIIERNLCSKSQHFELT